MSKKHRIFILTLIIMVFSVTLSVQASTGDLQISSEPGLLVYIDGEFKGKTSSTFEGIYIDNIPAGDHVVKIVKKGYEPKINDVRIKAGDTFVLKIRSFSSDLNISQEGEEKNLNIKAKKGTIIIRSIPIDCEISILGRTYDKTKDKFKISNIKYGNYHFTFKYKDIKINYNYELNNEEVMLKVDFRSQEVTSKVLSKNVGQKKWTFETEYSIWKGPYIDKNGNIYIGTGGHEDKLYSLDTEGNINWSLKFDDNVEVAGIDNRTIYVDCRDEKYYAVSTKGDIKWSIRNLTAPISIDRDGTQHMGCDDELFAISHNGAKKWVLDTKMDDINTTPVIYNRRIYIGGSCGKMGDKGILMAVRNNGSKLWELKVDRKIANDLALDNNGNIYFGCPDKKLYAVSPEGNIKWTYKANYYISSAPVIGKDGTIYFTDKFNFYALDSNGREKWSLSEGDYTSDPVVADNGVIYIKTEEKLLAINRDGTIRWEYDSESYESNLVLANDGTLYFVDDYNLYAIKGKSNGLANSPWPAAGHDSQHTGRY